MLSSHCKATATCSTGGICKRDYEGMQVALFLKRTAMCGYLIHGKEVGFEPATSATKSCVARLQQFPVNLLLAATFNVTDQALKY